VMFEAIVNGFAMPDDEVTRQAALPLLAMLILADTIDVDMIVDRVAIVFFETGRSDHPGPGDTVRMAVDELLADMRTAGILTGDRLTDFGRRMVLTGVRARAMQTADD